MKQVVARCTIMKVETIMKVQKNYQDSITGNGKMNIEHYITRKRLAHLGSNAANVEGGHGNRSLDLLVKLQKS